MIEKFIKINVNPILGLFAFLMICLSPIVVISQADCISAAPFCTGTPVTFPASTNTTAPPGVPPDYGCLGTQPNPSWYFLQVSQNGPIEITIDNSANLDIDFICWGPFASLNGVCYAQLNNGGVDCSYSIAATEICNIPNAQVGEFYMLLITNYSNNPTNISFDQTSGSGATDCTILNCPLSVTNTQSNCGQNDGTATATSNGTAPFTYNWSNGGTSQTLTGLAPGWYTVTVTDDSTCVAIDSTEITDPGGISVSIGNVVSPTCGTNNGQVAANVGGGVSPYTYLWDDGQNQTTQTATGLTGGNYEVTVTDVNGCTGIADTSLISIGGGTATITSFSDALCGGSNGSATVQGSGGATPYSYIWDDSSGQTSATATGLIGGQFSVTVTDIDGCQAVTQVTITDVPGPTLTVNSADASCANISDGTAIANPSGGTSPYGYLWDDVNSQTTFSATGLQAGTYNVTVSDLNGCTVNGNATVGAPAALNIISTSDTVICVGGTASLSVSASGGAGGFSYNWIGVGFTQQISVNPGIDTNYSVVAIDVNNCPSDTLIIPVQLFPLLAAGSVSPVIMCQGDVIPLSVTASGGNGVYNYSWNNGAGTGNPVSISPPVSTTFTAIVSDNCETPSVTADIDVVVGEYPAFQFGAFPASGCSPLAVEFTMQVDSIRPSYTYKWQFGDGSQVNSYSDTLYHTYSNSGCQDVGLTVTTDLGCAETITKFCMVNAYPSPEAMFQSTPSYPTNIDPVVTFWDKSSGATSWFWDLGDNYTSSFRNFSHTYLGDKMEYEVILKVMNEFGCIDSITSEIKLSLATTIYIPNAFTPDGDGINDYFGPSGESVLNDGFEFYVFNRWGDVIFKTDDLYEHWNGGVLNSSSKLVPQGVYIYKILYKENSGFLKEIIGKVTVLHSVK